LLKHERITDEDSPFYQDPEGFAMDYFNFYQCYDCKEPYFAGARHCGAAGEENFKPEELICGGCCKIESFNECPVHGSSFLIFKCRFCCSYSTFFCFGKTHFCDPCHNGSVWPKLVNSSGENQKTFPEYPQCAGLRSKVDAIWNDRLLTDEQKN